MTETRFAAVITELREPTALRAVPSLDVEPGKILVEMDPAARGVGDETPPYIHGYEAA